MKFSALDEVKQQYVIMCAQAIDRFVYRGSVVSSTYGQVDYVSYVPSTDVFHVAGHIVLQNGRVVNYASIKCDARANIIKITPKTPKQFMTYKEGETSIIVAENGEGCRIGNQMHAMENYNYIKAKFNWP